MNRFSDRFTVVLCADVLANTLRRGFLLSFAETGFYRPRWSKEIIDEATNQINIQANGKVDTENLCKRIDEAFPEAKSYRHEILVNQLKLGEQKDNLVLAVAVMVRASVIVTDKLENFPEEYLSNFYIKVKTADQYIPELIELSITDSIGVLQNMIMRYGLDSLGAESFIHKVEADGLSETAAILKTVKEDL